MTEVMQAVLPTLVMPADGGLGSDVAVPPAPEKYDAVTIIRMVKQVNRRGRVRYLQIGKTTVYRHTSRRNDIKGEDDLTAFVAEALLLKAPVSLVVSFEDRFDAKAFSRDLENLVVKPLAMEQIAEEHRRRVTLAARHERSNFPKPMRFPFKVGSGDYCGHRWVEMVAPTGKSPAELVRWMRRHTEYRYFAGVWKPGDQPQMAKKSWRYWRLSETQWQTLIDRCRDDDDLLLIVNFFGPLDAEAFDQEYGPSQFLTASAARRTIS